MQNNEYYYSVHKFGGSSLAQADRFIALKSLLKGKDEIIIVSAIRDTTSVLQAALDAAREGQSFLPLLVNLKNTHLRLVEALLPEDQCANIISFIQSDFDQIQNILQVIQLTRSYSKEIQAIILGYGETWSAKILTTFLTLHCNALYLDATEILFVYEKKGRQFVDWKKSQAALNHFLENKQFDQLIIPGFIATTLSGLKTTLGRNGSDFSAAIFAKLFKAKHLIIWTDVDGIFTADPHKVSNAFIIESLSYKEALELAYFGAKVLHPMTIAPVHENHIPIYVKNSYNPNAKGTHISSHQTKSSHLIKGVTCIEDIALINIEGAGMIGVSGIAAHVFEILTHLNVSVIFISQASSEYSICFAIANNEADSAIEALHENLEFELERKQIERISLDRHCAILAIVGDEMVGAVGILGKLSDSLAKANINIRAISQGSSERNISLVIKNTDVKRALQAIHAGFYLSHKTISIGLIGPGQVGKTFLQQLHAGLNELMSEHRVAFYVQAIMNSNKMFLSDGPLDLTDYQEKLHASNQAADVDRFVHHLLLQDVPHKVIIDCTANQQVAYQYSHFIDKGIHIITPNKHANAGDLHYYKQLKTLSHKKNRHYLYEATVCAGLPIINTLQDLIKTGDKILQIEGVFSGTLSYIFNELSKGRAFSDIVIEAKQLGFTEPDPREDLSGMDVARKLVCLAREVGHDISLDDVEVYDLVPSSLKNCSLAAFIENLQHYDVQMQLLVEKAQRRDEKLYYVGTIDEKGTIKVAIESYPLTHPFSNLKGTDNMVVFHTERYQQPLIIQGPGAGAQVTATGIFTDLLRLVSFL